MHGDKPQGKVAPETTAFGWVWTVVPLVQSDCRVLWSSMSIDISNIWHRDSHQRKVASKTITLGRVLPGVPSHEINNISRSSCHINCIFFILGEVHRSNQLIRKFHRCETDRKNKLDKFSFYSKTYWWDVLQVHL